MEKDLKDVKRISIVGGPGTGKTTLADKLSLLLNLPAIHLDGINYNANWEEIGKEKRDSIILEKIKQDEWIIDGNYSSTLQQRFESSDLVIWLDYSSFSIIKGVLSRYISNFNKEKQEIPGCKERISWEFLKFMITFRRKGRKRIAENIDKISKEKVIIFYNRKDLNEWLENIEKIK